ncbi:hypothetical protein [Streptomyces canus]|uniref:hypothetical protein n=1 Tax=Streptomyces canus TaxID=58343 RepID=UPI002E347A1C|nr:hypothetical protein [Streptomyces canus]
MSDALERAARDAVEAADNTDLTRQIVAILAAQQLLNQQQPTTVAQQATQPFDAKKWWTIGGLAIVGAGTVSVLAIAFALAAVAVAIGGTCATVCLLVLRSMWRDYRNGH